LGAHQPYYFEKYRNAITTMLLASTEKCMKELFSYLYCMIQIIRNWFETKAFGVCTWLGKKMGIKATTIRMYFIYLSFFTFGSPIIIYFILAFFLENKNYFKPRHKRPSVWDF
jgi:phage shock protein C